MPSHVFASDRLTCDRKTRIQSPLPFEAPRSTYEAHHPAHFLCFVILLGVCLLLTPGPSTAEDNKSKRPNILMIVVDDLNTEIGCMGGVAKTPNIDALAANSVLFENAYAPSPICNPSRSAILTGRLPHTSGVHSNEWNFRHLPGGKQVVTLPQYMRSLGYSTVAAGKNFHQSRGGAEEPNQFSDPVSWDTQLVGYVGTWRPKKYYSEPRIAKWHEGELEGHAASLAWGPIDTPLETTGDGQTAAFCANYLQQKHDKPFFLACGIYSPHPPYHAPKEYFDMYPLDAITLPVRPDNDEEDIPRVTQGDWGRALYKKMIEKNEYKKAYQAYLASTSFADDCVGKILRGLESSPHKDNTIVVFWSDHGYLLGEKNRWQKHSLWRKATRAPFMVNIPNVTPAGKVSKQTVSLIDIYPTIADLLGKPVELDGKSLVPHLKSPDLRDNRYVISSYHGNRYSIVKGRYNYIYYDEKNEELYDHQNDPMEWTNLAGKKELKEIKKSLKSALLKNIGK